MTRFTRLDARRQEGRRENGEDKNVRKYVDMLVQGGFQVAISHVTDSEWIRKGPSLRELLAGGEPLFAKRLKTEYAKAPVEESSLSA